MNELLLKEFYEQSYPKIDVKSVNKSDADTYRIQIFIGSDNKYVSYFYYSKELEEKRAVDDCLEQAINLYFLKVESDESVPVKKKKTKTAKKSKKKQDDQEQEKLIKFNRDDTVHINVVISCLTDVYQDRWKKWKSIIKRYNDKVNGKINIMTITGDVLPTFVDEYTQGLEVLKSEDDAE